MRCKLRTLLIVLALGPPVLAGAWWSWGQYGEWRERRAREREAAEYADAIRSLFKAMESQGGGLRRLSPEESARMKAMLEPPAGEPAP